MLAESATATILTPGSRRGLPSDYPASRFVRDDRSPGVSGPPTNRDRGSLF
jgi:hypothetical protein